MVRPHWRDAVACVVATIWGIYVLMETKKEKKNHKNNMSVSTVK